jgi:hypothetical protein
VGDDTVAHANEQVIRTMYDAFAHGDMESVLACRMLSTQRFTRNDGTPVEFRSAMIFRFATQR